ncbi:MAG: HAMP domain-containing histidine kinase [Verrucomicrobia bacterium]|nr:HAMP domain-containing histidine kinase [Verrucomicrobiota bacterium]
MRPRPQFFWQGLLIVLPAILLGGVGFYSLRQDRIIAEHDATEQAKKIAATVARAVLPDVLKAGPLAAISRFQTAPTNAKDDVVLALATARDTRVACEVNSDGELIYPPPFAVLPQPAPLDEPTLDATQRLAWAAASKAVFVDQRPGAGVDALERFASLQPPDNFTALAIYRLAVLCETQGDLQSAEENFRSVIEHFPDALGETGVPLKVFAALRLLQLREDRPPSVDRRVEWVNAICRWAALHPSPLSEFFLRKAARAEPEVEQSRLTSTATARAPAQGVEGRPGSDAAAWRAVWDAHEAARALWEVVQRRWIASGRIDLADATPMELGLSNGQVLLVTSQPAQGGHWLLAQTEENLRRTLTTALAAQSFPGYFGFSVAVAGRSILATGGDSSLLAAADAPGIHVGVHLVNPGVFYARQRVRTVWFGSLIGAATVAVLIGFLTAWRAFQRQQRLSEMKTNFVSSVSHELRAPIASVRLMAEELTDIGPHDRQKSKEYHRFIVQECRRLSGLIENVLDFARHEQGREQYEFEPTDLVALVQETARLMQAYAAERQIQLATAITGDPVAAEVDGQAIQQVLVNLIDNAIKHSPGGSAVALGLEFPGSRADDDEKSEVRSPKSEGSPKSEIPNLKSKIALFVEDRGEGIPPEDHARIFERFYRRGTELRRETQGVGLGLAIVKYVAEAHGGRVTVRSAVGQGSRFTVELPVSQSTVQSPASEAV